MSTTLGSASHAREITKLFEAWRRAFDLHDHATMVIATRAIDATTSGRRRAWRRWPTTFADIISSKVPRVLMHYLVPA